MGLYTSEFCQAREYLQLLGYLSGFVQAACEGLPAVNLLQQQRTYRFSPNIVKVFEIGSGATVCRLLDLLRQQHTLLTDLSSFASDSADMIPPAASLNHPSLTKAFAAAAATLKSVTYSLSKAATFLYTAVSAAPVATLSSGVTGGLLAAPSEGVPRAGIPEPLVCTRDVLAAMRDAAAALETAAGEVRATGGHVTRGLDTPEITGDLTVARLHPAWPRLQAALDEAAASCALGTLPVATAATGEATAAADDGSGAVASLAASTEDALRSTIIWAQGPDVSSARDRNTPPTSSGNYTESSERLCRLMTAPALFALVKALEATARTLQPPTPPMPPRLVRQLRGVLGMINALCGGLWAAVMHGVIMHDAGTRLLVVSTGAFVAYMTDGFGSCEVETGQDADDGTEQGEGGAFCLTFPWHL
jgi:hypothetical protein